MFQGGTFSASTSTPFGQSTFGKPATTGFNAPAFGTGTTSLFGGGTALPSTGLFGASTQTPAFGQTQAQPSFGGGFSSAPSGSGLFGAQQNANTTGLFGASTSTPFGQTPKPTFGAFASSSTPGTGMFSSQPAQQTSLFGQPAAQSASGLFGSAFGGAASGGTTLKFTPLNGSDTMVKNGVSTTINTRHQCITCMKEYESKSLEELRLEDYMANRKGPQQGSQTTGGIFGSGGQTPFFGAPNTGTSTGFGTGGATSVFGSTSAFGKPTGSTAPTFGTPATTTQPAFGFNTGTSMFGSNTNQVKPFGATTQGTGMFGSTSQPSSGFGTQSTGFGGFGNQQGGLFGQNKTGFGMAAPTGTGLTYGQTATTTPGSFSFTSKPGGTGFGTPATGFGATSTTGSGLGIGGFGTTNQNTSLFGNFGQTSTPSFGFGQTSTSNALGTGMGLGAGNTLFSNTQAKPGGLFGQNTTSTGLFGGSTFGSTTSPFGAAAGGLQKPTGFGTLGATNTGLLQNAGAGAIPSQTTNNTLNQHMLALASMPFGDSPLFKNLLPATGKADELIKPTSPAAQKALIAGQNFKVSPKSGSKIKVKPIGGHLSKKSLFDGLESDDEQADTSISSPIVGWSDRKRLGIKQRPFTDNTMRHVSFLEQSPEVPCTSPLAQSPGTPVPSTSRFGSSPNIAVFSAAPSRDTVDRVEPVRSDITPKGSSTVTKNRSSDANDSVTELRPQENVSLCSRASDQETGGAGEPQDETSSSTSGDSEVEDTVACIIENDTDDHPAGIVLRRSGYYTIPSLDDLTSLIDSEGRCIVDNFTIGRLNYGNIFYPESFDVSGLNIDEIVHFRHKEVVVYPDDDKKPEVGKGLNRRAQVTLDRVWPIDKATRFPISDPDRISEMDYESKLRRTCAKHGTRFVEYRPQTGSWVFKVEHFSKYGLSDSDEEDAAPVADSKKSKVAPPGTVPFRVPGIPPSTFNPKLMGQLPPLEPGPQLFLEEDEDMEDGISTPFDLDDDYQREAARGSKKILGDLESSSHKVQLMKASFFHSEPDLGEEYLPYDELNSLGRYIADYRRDMYVEEKPQPSFPLREYFPPLPQRMVPRDEPDMGQEVKLDSNLPLEMEEDDIDPSASVIRPDVFSLKHQGEVIPSPLTCGGKLRGKCLAEMSIMFGSSVRPCWSLDSEMTTLSTFKVTSSIASRMPLFSLSKPLVGRDKTDMSPYLLQKMKICGGLDLETDTEFVETIESQLEVALKESHVFIDEKGVPAVTPKPGVSALHQHHIVAENMALSAKDALSTFWFHVWGLCLALWGNIPHCDVPDNHACVMARRNEVSDWLEAVVSKSVEADLKTPSNGLSSSVFSLMTGGSVIKAATSAQEGGVYRHSLLLSQSKGSSIFRNLIKKQLAEWKETSADRHIDKDRLKIFMLIAGEPVHFASDTKVNSFLGLDWLRTFAMHLWYICPQGSSVTDALLSYEESFNVEHVSSPPFPHYVKDFSIDSSKRAVYDICYHLFRLYSYKTHPLEKLLNPATHTPDPLDYRLSWLIMRFLQSMGYSHLSPNSAYVIHSSFASQLESFGLWHWAVFVFLHLPDSHERSSSIMTLLSQHISLDDDPKVEEFLKDLLIPEIWINEAKASRALYEKKFNDAAKYLLLSENWNHAHSVIIEHIMPKAIINEKYDYLEDMLAKFEANEAFKQVVGWQNGGFLVVQYLRIIKEVEEVVSSKEMEIAYYLERLQPQLLDLNSRIKLLPVPTPLHRLSQAEMAKRCSALIRSLSVATEDDTDKKPNTLTSLVSQLPLPSDFAQQEWQAVVTSWSDVATNPLNFEVAT